MMTDSGSHVVGGSGLAPLVDELAAAQREPGAHVRIAEGEDLALLVHALGGDELEDTVLVLRDGEIGDGAYGGIELGEIAAAGLAVEHGHNLHGRLLGL